MSTKPLILAIFALSIICADAAPLTPDQALERALNDRSCAKIISRGHAHNMRLMYELKPSSTDESVCYVFSAPSAGFVMLSADDMAVPVLGYGDSAFDADRMPDGLRYMLDMYASEIAECEQSAGETHYIPKQRPALEPIAPMLSTKWDQDSPYNLLCPKLNNKRCPTGCVATALAQVANYYEYPSKGKGTASYNWQYKTLTFDFEATAFDWENMHDTYPTAGNTSTDPACNAVATLMYAIGVASQMDYGSDSSGAYDQNALEGMIRNLDYNPNARLAYRHHYGIIEWEQLVYDNLINCGPTYYSGSTLMSDGSIVGGHAFVCDGYSHDGYFHINWGWGGISDGYFLLSALSPIDLGSGGGEGTFNYMQFCMTDLVPAPSVGDDSKPYQGMYMYRDFKITPEEAALGSEISYCVYAVNLSTETLSSATYGLRIEALDGVSTIIESTTDLNIKPQSVIYRASLKATLPEVMPDGIYTVRPGFIAPDGTWHDFAFDIGLTEYLNMDVADGMVRFYAPDILVVDGEILDVEAPIVEGIDFECSLRLYNPNSMGFFNKVMLLLLEPQDGALVATGGYVMVSLLPGETAEQRITARFTGVAPGDYILVPCTESSKYYLPLGDGVSVEVIERPEGDLEVKLLNPEVAAVIESDGAGRIDAGIDAECTSGAGLIYMLVAIYDPSSEEIYSEQSTLKIVSGQTKRCTYSIDISDAVDNDYYQLFYGWYDDSGKWKSWGYFPFLFSRSGIADITADDAPLNSVLYDLNGRPAAQDYKGIVVRLSTMPDGSRCASVQLQD